MQFNGQASREYRKKVRAERLNSIVVTITRADGTTLSFDGDEESQKRLDRFSRRATESGTQTLPWTMADNSVMEITPDEMTQALDLALQEQGAQWFL
jgi:hypothetical protein